MFVFHTRSIDIWGQDLADYLCLPQCTCLNPNITGHNNPHKALKIHQKDAQLICAPIDKVSVNDCHSHKLRETQKQPGKYLFQLKKKISFPINPAEMLIPGPTNTPLQLKPDFISLVSLSRWRGSEVSLLDSFPSFKSKKYALFKDCYSKNTYSI